MLKRDQKLHLRMAEGSRGLMPIIELLDVGQRRFVGIKIRKIVDENNEERFVFEVKPEGDIVKYHPEYVKAVKNGTLEPVNIETAKLCKTKFKK